MFPKLAILCFVSLLAHPAVGIVEESSLDKTVEDVETLRVLVTTALSTSVAVANVGLAGWRLDRTVRNPDRDDEVKENGEREAGAKDDTTEKDDGSTSGDFRLAWLRTLHPGMYADSNGAYVLGNTESPTSYTRAFYAPGIGAWIDTNLKVPYALIESRDGEKGSESKGDDDWNAAKRALKNETPSGPSSTQGNETRRAMLTLDPKRIDAAIAAVAGVLREHGHRVRGLENDENVVVALKIEGDGILDGTNDNAAWNATSLALRYYRDALSVHSGRIESKTIVIRAPKSLIDAAANGEIDGEAFRERLSITRY